MRPVSPRWPITAATSHRAAVTVEAYYDGRLLTEVPIIDGTLTFDATAKLSRRATITVPARTPATRTGSSPTYSWIPGDDPYHPLAAYGQRLHINAGLYHPDGSRELCDQGWYLIDSWDTDGDTVTVDAVDLRRLIEDARLYFPESPPTPPGSHYSEFVRLVDGILPATPLPTELPDRPITSDRIWERERGEALDTLTKAWPATWRVDDEGRAAIAAPLPPEQPLPEQAVARFVDGQNGTVISRGRAAQRGKVNNAIVVLGKTPGPDDPFGRQPAASTEITDPTNPLHVAGPYGRVPRFYASDMIVSLDQAYLVALTMIGRYAATARTDQVAALPDPALQLDDIASVTVAGQTFTGRIASIKLPLGPGVMELDVISGPTPDDQDES